MKQITKYMGLVAIVTMFALATVSGSMGTADAAKAEGSDGTTSPKSYGSATDKIVCGDTLCETGTNPPSVGKAR